MDAIAYEQSAVGSLPYSVDAHALQAVRGSLYGTASDYVVTYSYNQQTGFEVYSLYLGKITSSQNALTCVSGRVYEFQYLTTSHPVSASQAFSGSFSGQAIGQSPSALQGSFNGSVPYVNYQYTIRYDCDITDIPSGQGVTVDSQSIIYGSMDDLPHIERGYSYADIGQAVALPLLLCAFCGVLYTQIFRKFG